MGAAHPSVVRVLHAERDNGSRPSEDRIFLTENAVIILDGASQPETTERNGGWMAEQLGTALAQKLHVNAAIDLAKALEAAIEDTATTYNLRPGSSPSTTVAIVRWFGDKVDVLVLCDSPVIVADRWGTIHQIRDDRLSAVGKAIPRPKGFRTKSEDNWQALVATERLYRNRPGGYWVAEATPAAAHQAIQASFSLDDISLIMAMTDGVSIGVDRYGVPADWRTALTLASDDPARVIELVHNAEMSDPDGERWPRSKRHDDKTISIILFEKRWIR